MRSARRLTSWFGLWVLCACGTRDAREGASDAAGQPARAAARLEGGASGGVDATGGRVDRLRFAIIGDTRPASVDDTAGYPTGIITRIFQDIQALQPPPPFAVSTGDYMFASTGGGQAAAQLDVYLRARRAFSGVVFPAMGNHECTGATASNCGDGNADGVTDNYAQFLSKMLQPLGRAAPYYAVPIGALDGSWSAKFVFVAANAWDGAQADWLDATLGRPTTYTFVVRHEPAAATSAPGVSPSEQIMSRHPFTLSIVGHSHTYDRSGPNEVIVGNGGAPLAPTAPGYGFGLAEQRADGAIRVDMIDYQTMQRDQSFTFAVRPDGSPAP
ncbi:MAG TPA: metallophosphoesterase [Polyangiaceae bacterium]|nr:metallophosphoesterase [Polyangiaceae bacterium]